MRSVKLLGLALALTVGTLLVTRAWSQVPPACNNTVTERTWTDDFWIGSSINTTSVTSADLAILETPQLLDTIWIACSARGTVLRINTATRQIEGEYLTSPTIEGAPNCGRNPSRTTVDFDGNVWVANRESNPDASRGAVVKIGSGFAFQWVDRNNNGILDTSNGLDDVKAWPNDNSDCEPTDVSLAADELILLYRSFGGFVAGTRTVAVDRRNHVWVGGIVPPREHGLLDGRTGELLDVDGDGPDFPFANYQCPGGEFYGGYGGLVDRDGFLWSASGGGFEGLLRLDPSVYPPSITCFDLPHSYGLAVDLGGNIWNTRYTDLDDYVSKIDQALGVTNFPVSQFSPNLRIPKGVAVSSVDVDPAAPSTNHVWIANTITDNVTRLDNDLNNPQLIDLTFGGFTSRQPTGVAVDFDGEGHTSCATACAITNPSIVARSRI